MICHSIAVVTNVVLARRLLRPCFHYAQLNTGDSVTKPI